MANLPLVRRAAAFRAIWRAVRESRRPDSPGIQDRLAAVPSMFRDALRGEYHGLSWPRVALMAAAAVYIASPLDLVPEALLLVVGVGDDVVVAAWLTGALLEEVEHYLEWKNGQPTVIRGEVIPPG